MTQEEKDLLIRDLCARLPYGVKVYAGEGLAMTLKQIDYKGFCESWENEDLKCHSRWMLPYLRPMSSMTDGEKEELTEEHKKDERIYIEIIERVANGDESARGTAVPHFAADWCNEHHFDYRGLIEKGFAIAVTENNNPYKE